MKGGHLIFQAASNVSCSQLMAASRIWLGYVVCCRVRGSLGVCFYYTTFELQEGGYNQYAMLWHAPARRLGLASWREMRGV